MSWSDSTELMCDKNICPKCGMDYADLGSNSRGFQYSSGGDGVVTFSCCMCGYKTKFIDPTYSGPDGYDQDDDEDLEDYVMRKEKEFLEEESLEPYDPTAFDIQRGKVFANVINSLEDEDTRSNLFSIIEEKADKGEPTSPQYVLDAIFTDRFW
jgi:hypothetical protein